MFKYSFSVSCNVTVPQPGWEKAKSKEINMQRFPQSHLD